MKPKGFPGLEFGQWLPGRMPLQLKNSLYFFSFFSEITVLCCKCLTSEDTSLTYFVQFSGFLWQGDKAGPWHSLMARSKVLVLSLISLLIFAFRSVLFLFPPKSHPCNISPQSPPSHRQGLTLDQTDQSSGYSQKCLTQSSNVQTPFPEPSHHSTCQNDFPKILRIVVL